MKTMTPELIGYSTDIVKERGIKREDMTYELMGEVIREAVRRMDKAVQKLQDSKDAQTVISRAIYDRIPAGKTELVRNPYKLKLDRRAISKSIKDYHARTIKKSLKVWN